MALALLLLFFSQSAYAYLDPASGSAIAYIVVSVVTASFFYLKNFAFDFCYWLKALITGERQARAIEEIVIYSEGKQYWPVFAPVVQALLEKQQDILYLTSDKTDPVFNVEHQKLRSRYIGSVNHAGSYLKQVRAKVLAMTTPQLDVLNIKRSKNVQHYAHIVHAPVDVFTYRKFAFDYFDSVFCSGPHQIKSIRALEEKRSLPFKELFETGCTYFDEMLRGLRELPEAKSDRFVVLVAPTWKTYSLLHVYGEKFFDLLLNDPEVELILRPHPQMFVSYPEIIDRIIDRFKDHPRFYLDRAPTGIESMLRSSVMISDLSGVIWDYVFLFQKPVYLMKTPLNLDGFEATELEHEMWELASISKIGRYLSDEDLNELSTMLKNSVTNKTDLTAFRNESIYNFGSAGKVAANQLMGLLEKEGGA